MSVEACTDLICLVPINVDGYRKIFGFAEFLAALALLAVLYTVTDIRYKFRVAVAPGYMFPATYELIAFIGVSTLMTEVWVAQKWHVPLTTWLNSTVWQAGMGLLFLGTFLTWTYYAYVRPPVFGYRNGRRYSNEVIRYAMRGNDDEMRVIVNEIARSSMQLLKHWNPQRDVKYNRWNPAHKTLSGSRNVLLLLGDRRICKIIVKSSPVTALSFFEDMALNPHRPYPLSAFSRNITMEAIAQRDSFLYNEVAGYKSGLLGYAKPISQALYGNFQVIANLKKAGGVSTFDFDYSEALSWDSSQWSAYFRAVLITLKSFLETGDTNSQEPVISSALDNINTAYSGLSKLSGMDDPYRTETFRAFGVVCEFATSAVNLVNEAKHQPYVHHVRDGKLMKNIYDQLAELAYELCIDSASVKGTSFAVWDLQHNNAWSVLHGFKHGAAWTVIRLKTRRLLFEQIDRMVEFPNYVSIRAIAFCLNVFGLAPVDRKNSHGRGGFAVSRKAQAWAKENFLTVERDYPEMVEVMLSGSISFDKENSRLVQTNHYGMSKKPTYKYLDLLPPMAGESVPAETMR